MDQDDGPGSAPMLDPASFPIPAPAPPLPHGTLPRGTRILACVLCQNRKIKCDRATPSCANCIKAGIKCTPSTPAPARKRRRPNQDLQERLARCEALIKHPQAGRTGRALSSSSPSAAHEDSPYLQWKPAGKIESSDGSSKFVDSYLFANLYNELKAMKNILEEDEGEDRSMTQSDQAATPDDGTDLLTCCSPSPNVEDFLPAAVHVFQLWQIFIDRVNPLTKLIHVPTLQPHLVQAATNPAAIPLTIQALLFAIYCVSVVSLDEAECQQIIGQSRDGAIARFSSGVRAALAKASFITCYDIYTVQALAIYLVSLQGRYSRDAMWIINGVTIRIAQKLGFHRDGEIMGLTPYETEMQRRIWWYIILHDTKLAMQSGLSHSHLPRTWDTRRPSNINDADISPGSTELVRARDGPTEMVFCLLAYRVGEFMLNSQGNPGFEAVIMGQEMEAAQNPSVTNDESIDKYRSLLVSLDSELAAMEEKYVDASASPIHMMAKAFRSMVMEKVWTLMVPIREQPEFGTEIFTPRDNLFKVSITVAHNSLKYYDVLAELGFLWYVKMHMQVDVFAVALGQLCNRVSGSLVDRAWEVVDKTYYYHKELHDMSHRNNVMLGTFALKAWKARERALAGMGKPVSPPDCIRLIREIMPGGHGTLSEAATTIATTTSPSPSRPATSAQVPPSGLGPAPPSSHAVTSPLTSAPPQMPSPDMGGDGKIEGLDVLLNDSWGMGGFGWGAGDYWPDAGGAGHVAPMPMGQIPPQQAPFIGFGGGGNGLGW